MERAGYLNVIIYGGLPVIFRLVLAVERGNIHTRTNHYTSENPYMENRKVSVNAK